MESSEDFSVPVPRGATVEIQDRAGWRLYAGYDFSGLPLAAHLTCFLEARQGLKPGSLCLEDHKLGLLARVKSWTTEKIILALHK